MMNFPVALVFLMLSTVADLAHHEDTNTQCSPVLSNFNLNNVEVLEQLVDNRIRTLLANAAVTNITVQVLEQLVDNRIRAALANAPVTGMLSFVIESYSGSSRIARIRVVDVKTLRLGAILDEADLSNPSQIAAGANNTVYYRPRYQDVADFGHGGANTTAVFFINMENAFPCIKSLSYHYRPICKIFTNEEDGFRSYRPIIEAADSGNYFRIFNSRLDIPTYGFGIPGCAEFTSNCLPTHHHFVIVCYLPC